MSNGPRVFPVGGQRVVSAGRQSVGNAAPPHTACRLLDSSGKPIGPHRVWLTNAWVPGLAMSRALGDTVAHSVGVSAVPDTDVTNITPQVSPPDSSCVGAGCGWGPQGLMAAQAGAGGGFTRLCTAGNESTQASRRGGLAASQGAPFPRSKTSHSVCLPLRRLASAAGPLPSGGHRRCVGVHHQPGGGGAHRGVHQRGAGVPDCESREWRAGQGSGRCPYAGPAAGCEALVVPKQLSAFRPASPQKRSLQWCGGTQSVGALGLPALRA